MPRALSFREAQQASFETLVQLRDVCASLGITYSLAYGTLIGAVREHGLIPWDDDVDVMMPREDYDRLRMAFLTRGNRMGNLRWVDFHTTAHYPHAIARISDERYRLSFDNEAAYEIGAFVDVYPFDNVGGDLGRAVALLARTKALAHLCFLSGRRRFGRDNTRSLAKMAAKVPAYALAKALGTRRLVERLERLCDSLAEDDGAYVACTLWPAGDGIPLENKVFPRELFETIDGTVNGEAFPITRHYDDFLTKTYGSYMTRPNPKDRTTNHVYTMYRR